MLAEVTCLNSALLHAPRRLSVSMLARPAFCAHFEPPRWGTLHTLAVCRNESVYRYGDSFYEPRFAGSRVWHCVESRENGSTAI
jgi:hypothetical protein